MAGVKVSFNLFDKDLCMVRFIQNPTLWPIFVNENGSALFHGNILSLHCTALCNALSVTMVCLLQPTTKCQQFIYKSSAPYVTLLFHAHCRRAHTYLPRTVSHSVSLTFLTLDCHELKQYMCHLSCEHHLVQNWWGRKGLQALFQGLPCDMESHAVFWWE